MPLYTTKYALPYPVPSDKADPPRDIKALADRAELVFGALLPIGTIVPFGGATIPSRWKLCDGSAHTSDALAALIGSYTLPDLRTRFPVGAGGRYAVGATGGVASVTLTADQSGAGTHAHAVTVSIGSTVHTHDWPALTVMSGWVNQNHQHIGDPGAVGLGGGGHEHGVVVREGYDPASGNEGNQVDTHPTAQPGDKQVGYTNGGGGHEHYYDIGAFWSYGMDTNHDHWVDEPELTSGAPSNTPGTSGNVGTSTPVAASQAHENRPPYIAMRFIIKTGVA